MNKQNFGDYIIYVDESGDHSLEKINPRYPIFSLAFCIFKKAAYVEVIVPKMIELKFNGGIATLFCMKMIFAKACLASGLC